MKTVSLSVAFAAVAILAGTSAQAAANATKCQAKAFFSREQAYHSGIVFVHGNKTHDLTYGVFQGSVNYTDIKTPLLNNGTVGHDKHAKAYGWGNVAEYGFLGSANDFLFGLQLAMGSIAGLMEPEVEDQLRSALNDQDTGKTVVGTGFSELQTNNGRAINTAIQAVLNSTQTRINTAKEALDKKKKSSSKSSSTSKRDLQTRDDDEQECEETNSKSNVKATTSRGASNDDEAEDDNDNDESDEDDDSSSSSSSSSKSAYTNPPSMAAMYRPPWGSARPVYFYGQCDHCDNSTGYTSGGHGKFQSCTLIYRGKEYKGTVSNSKSKHMCDIDFDC